ncbi:condensin, SMC5-subunit [Planoprotostelium fungivorum]|uniref:Condensin, SMC5-subunit n=1 Tax=Planoprotostelium fungivorum TaxID=1890364 RepID=A0A2P6NTX8_9EUKA|nr:condensin, SMC5-subunit [Planoprotostelium fungivorum]
MSKADGHSDGTALPVPDTGYKMCKKIAQLTKVVHHLHSQNEMHQQNVREVALNYEGIIDEVKNHHVSITLIQVKIVKDANWKLNCGRDMVEERDSTISKLRMDVMDEQNKTAKNVTELRNQADNREAALHKSYALQIDELKRSLEDTKQKHGEEKVEWMSASQNAAEEQNRKLALEVRHRQEAEEQVNNLQKQLRAASDHYSTELKHLSLQHSDSQTKLEVTNWERAKREQEEKTQLQEMIWALEQKVKSSGEQLTDTRELLASTNVKLASAQSEIEDSQQRLMKANQEIQQLQHTIQDHIATIQQLNRDVANRNQQITDGENNITELKSERENLLSEIKDLHKRVEQERERLSEREINVADLERKLSIENAANVGLKNSIETLKNNFTTEIEQLNHDVQNAQSELAMVQTAAERSRQVLLADKELLRGQMLSQLDAERLNTLSAVKNTETSANQQIDRLREQYEAKSSALRLELRDLNAEMLRKDGETEDKVRKLKQEASDTLDQTCFELKTAHSVETSSLKKAADEAAKAAAVTVQSLKDQITSLEAEILRAEQKREARELDFEQMKDLLKQDLSNMKNNFESVKNDSLSTLRSQLEELFAERNQKALKDLEMDLLIERTKIINEMSNAAAVAAEASAAQLAALQRQLDERETSLAALRSDINARIEADKLKDEKHEAEKEEIRQQIVATLEEAKQAGIAMAAVVREEADKAMTALKEKFELELEELRQQHNQQMSESLSQTTSVYDQRFRVEIETAMQKYTALTEEYENFREDSALNLSVAKNRLNEAEGALLLSKKEVDHMRGIIEKGDTKITQLSKDIQRMDANASRLNKEMAAKTQEASFNSS